MVYCGRPSRGCQNCKSRRIKCDETRPKCLNCEKTNRACPGFPEEVDLIFRNENPGLKRKARKTSTSGKKGDASTAKTAVDENDAYADPDTLDSRKRRRRDTRSSVEDDDSSVSSRRDSKQSEWSSQFEEQSAQSPTIEQQATNFFFKNFVLPPQGVDTTRGYLEVAASMFDHAEEGSPLRLATEAVAVSAMANNPRRKHLAQLAGRLYGQALAATQKAIQNPKEATSDATLLSILLFALYESITSSDHSLPAWTKHIDGAVAIVKARGVKQFENAQSLSLFRSVRAQMLANAIQQHKPIDDFPGPNGWLSDLSHEQSAALDLLNCSIALPNFVSNANVLVDRERLNESIGEVEKLLEQALETQQALRTWESYIPPKWAYTCATNVSSTIDEDEIDDLEAWPGPIHSYQDVNVSSIRNNNRVNQMLCSSVVIDALKWLDPTGYTYDEKYVTAKNRVQTLVDDICYSVPFHLGHQSLEDANVVEEYSKTMTEAMGGYLLIRPLHAASNMKCIPDTQRRWIRGRMHAIARHYGLEKNFILSQMDTRQLDVSNLFDQTACSFPSPMVREEEHRPSQDRSVYPLQADCDHERPTTHNKNGMLLIDPVLLAITHSDQQILSSQEITSLTPTCGQLVTAL